MNTAERIEETLQDAGGDTYTLSTSSAGTEQNPRINVFGPTQFMQFDRASLDAFYQAGIKLLKEQAEPEIDLTVSTELSTETPEPIKA